MEIMERLRASHQTELIAISLGEDFPKEEHLVVVNRFVEGSWNLELHLTRTPPLDW